MDDTLFKIVLVSPEIPWNVGAIGRTCVGLGLELIIIKPSLVDITDKAVKRAGLDYWPFVKIKTYESWDDFLATEKPMAENLFFLSTKASEVYYNAGYSKGCYVVFGAESKGLPEFYHKTYAGRFFKLPMFSEKIRSYNLANTATTVAFEALRQINYSR